MDISSLFPFQHEKFYPLESFESVCVVKDLGQLHNEEVVVHESFAKFANDLTNGVHFQVPVELTISAIPRNIDNASQYFVVGLFRNWFC